ARARRKRISYATARSPLIASTARSDCSAVTNTLACAMSRVTSTSDTLTDGSPCSATASRTSVPSSLRSCAAMRSVRLKDFVIAGFWMRDWGFERSGRDSKRSVLSSPHSRIPNPGGRLQRPLDLDALEALDLVARLDVVVGLHRDAALGAVAHFLDVLLEAAQRFELAFEDQDRKSTRLNSSHVKISYAVFCLKKKKNNITH